MPAVAGEPGHRAVHNRAHTVTIAVVVFPGSNCEEDVRYAFQNVLGEPTDLVWHKDSSLDGYDAAILPGGFAHGDYLRPGAVARFSPIMTAIEKMRDSIETDNFDAFKEGLGIISRKCGECHSQYKE